MLEISHLSAQTRGGVALLRDVSLSVAAGEVHGLVGTSGAGKSMIGRCVLGILPDAVRITAGSIRFDGHELVGLSERARRAIGRDLAMIPQDPLSALNPSHRIAAQMTDVMRHRLGLSRGEAEARALAMLREVHIRDPARVLHRYPHELSGGMRQRVLIATAFACTPKLIVADEPTTALDVTVQKQILRLIRDLQRAHGTAVLFVTHDLGVVAKICGSVSVLRGGEVVEQAPVAEIIGHPSHAYTRALFAATARGAFRSSSSAAALRSPAMTAALLRAEGVRVTLADRAGKRPFRRAPMLEILHGVDLSVDRGEAVGIVGESGSGKTTLGRALLRLIVPAAGRIMFDGQDITHANEAALRPLRARMQMVFQNPLSSLNPRRSVLASVAAPLRARGDRDARARAVLALERAGLSAALGGRYPHQLSGGQRQRVGIARAIATEPAFILADEIVSGLDVTTQAQILDLLRALRRDMGLALAFITHDLSVVRVLCERVVVMHQGRIVEQGSCAEVFAAPQHPYTRRLLAAVPLPDIDDTWLDAPEEE